MASDPLNIKARDGRDDMPIFIHSELDDYGLSAIEFRVYARLARRCGRSRGFESVPNMAKAFEVTDRTIQRALRVLVLCNLIAEDRQPGKPTNFTLHSQRLWYPKSQLKQIREQVALKKPKKQAQVVTPERVVVVTPQQVVSGDTGVGGDMRAGGVVTPERVVVVTPEPDEGTPMKVLPLKEDLSQATPSIKASAYAPPDLSAQTKSKISGGGARAPAKPPDPRSQHPAIQACRKIASTYPPIEIYDELIEAIGEEPDIGKLTKCRKAYVIAGLTRTGWKWATEWYTLGIPEWHDPEAKKGNGNADAAINNRKSGQRPTVTRDYSHYGSGGSG